MVAQDQSLHVFQEFVEGLDVGVCQFKTLGAWVVAELVNQGARTTPHQAWSRAISPTP